ncbi:AraC family transcriptional regulator [Alcanivorax sp. 1008]|uniref:AraC family transcriptional regulator n=1 Tax=Alcanivorax sp. 1008 TaxID=2816853 RepID=UPI001D527FA0|nr:AraC family transcriptional regulator [Alcanivorax sp. 1008]MCC1495945.1 AraC family transcriptional regulator [Alcanivorax sp. 1008]
MQKTTIASHYVRTLLLSLKRANIDYQEHLRHAGISEAVLDDERARIPYESYVTLTRSAWKALGDENLNLTETPLKLGAFRYTGMLMLHTPTLRHALKLGMDFHRYINPGYEISLTEESNGALIEVSLHSPALDENHLFAEFILSGWHRFSSWLIDRNIVLKHVSFDFPSPPHEAEYQYIFPCPRDFNQDSLSIRFGAHYLDQPIVKSDDDFAHYTQQTPAGLLIVPADDDSYSAKIRRQLDACTDCRFPSFDEVARTLHMTPKTLRQKLKKEGIIYQEIKDVIRRDSAIHYLTLYRMPVADIALRVGFTETGAFIRAFKGWTGVTPGAYRH